jgi:hypothetical protein
MWHKEREEKRREEKRREEKRREEKRREEKRSASTILTSKPVGNRPLRIPTHSRCSNYKNGSG